jgi:hypothetical protein
LASSVIQGESQSLFPGTRDRREEKENKKYLNKVWWKQNNVISLWTQNK